MDITVDGEENLTAVECIPLSRFMLCDVSEAIKFVESKAFASLNSCICWIGINASPFCATFPIQMQQAAPTACVKDLPTQCSELKRLKTLKTTISFHRNTYYDAHDIRILVIFNAGQTAEYGLLC